MIDKKYPRIGFNDKVLNCNLISMLFILLFVIIFFNNSPETDFEIFLYELLIKDRGVYSQIYPFPSQIISNLIMWLMPISALSLSLTIKFNYLSEQEIINLGGFVEKNFYKKFFNNTVMIVSIFAAIFICLFPIYIYYAPLDKIAIRTTFIRDSFVTVIFLPYFYYMSSMLVMSLFLNLVFHPITFFKYQYKIPWYGRKDKIRSLVKNKRKNEK